MRIGVFFLAIVLLAACGPKPVARQEQPPLPAALLSAAQGGLRLTGQVSGPLPGLGPELDLDAWVRGDGWLRAELRYELPDGRPAHDVLVWTPEAALLVDRRRGDLTILGEGPGDLEAEGTQFRVAHVVWLGLGRAVPEAAALSWERRDAQWRGRLGRVGMRLETEHDDRWRFSELAWRREGETAVSLRAEPSGFVPTPWGPVPSRLSLDGAALKARVQVEWSVQVYESMGDTLFDPLWRP